MTQEFRRTKNSGFTFFSNIMENVLLDWISLRALNLNILLRELHFNLLFIFPLSLASFILKYLALYLCQETLMELEISNKKI